MSAEELEGLGTYLFGPNWYQRLGDALMVDRTTVNRWALGTHPIPGPAAVAIRCMAKIRALLEDTGETL